MIALVFSSSVPQLLVAQEVGEANTPVVNVVNVEEIVREYFSDIPIMAEVARCESRFRQYDESGNVLRGEENRRDVGVMQINEDHHLKDALELKMDLYRLEGNLSYARHLYEKMGMKPWVYSKKCWGKSNLASR